MSKISEKIYKLKKYKKVFFLFICIGILGIAFNRSYDRFVVTASQATKKVYSQNIATNEVDISTGEVFRKTFRTDRNGLSAIQLKINKEQVLRYDDCVVLQLYDDATGELVKGWVVEGYQIWQGRYTTLTLDKELVGVNGNTYTLYLQKIPAGEERPENLRQSGTHVRPLHNRMSYALVGNSSAFVMTYFKAFALFFAAIVIGCLSIVLFTKKIKLEKVTLLYVLLFGLVYMLVFPPFSVPDEYAHFVSSYNVSNKMLGKEEQEDDEIIMQDVYQCDGYFTRYASLRHYQYIIDAFHADSGNAEVELAKTYNYVSDAGHYISALGITLARVLNLGYIYMIYFGRVFNLIFFAVCMYFAVKIIPIGKECLFAVSMLPMAMQQCSSNSYDGYILSLAFLLIAYIMNLIYKKRQVVLKDVIIIGILLALLYPCKYIYSLLVLLLILVPMHKIIHKKQIMIAVSIVVCVFAVRTGIMLFGSENTTASEEINEELSIEEIEEETEAELSGTELYTNLKSDFGEGAVTYSLKDIVERPMETINIFINTIRDLSTYYIETMVGKYLGSLNIEISGTLIIGFYILLLLSGLRKPDDDIKIPLWHRFVFGLIFLAIVGSAMLAMFISWTRQPSGVIQGVQGRYFLPALPLLVFTLKMDAIEVKKDCTRLLCVGCCLLQFFVLLYGVEKIVSIW